MLLDQQRIQIMMATLPELGRKHVSHDVYYFFKKEIGKSFSVHISI